MFLKLIETISLQLMPINIHSLLPNDETTIENSEFSALYVNVKIKANNNDNINKLLNNN